MTTTPTTPAPDDIQKAALEVVERLGNTRGNILWVKRSAEIVAAALAAQRRKEDQVSERLDGLLKELVALAESWERIEGGTTGDIGVVFHGCAIQLRSEISALQKTQPSNDPLPFSAIRAEMEREP